jgi:hypothetical protein
MMTNQFRSGSTERREYWQQQVEAFNRSGMTLQGFCAERNLSYTNFCSWRRRLGAASKRKESRQDVVSVTVLPEVGKRASEGIRICVEGVQIEFADSPDPQWLASVVLAVGSRRPRLC